MFQAMISPIFRSTSLYVTACGIMHPRCCRPVAWKRRNPHPVYRPAGSSVHYSISCKHSLVLLSMGEIIARNMLKWLELLINRHCCIYLVFMLFISMMHGQANIKRKSRFIPTDCIACVICSFTCIHSQLPKSRKKACWNCADWNVSVIINLILQPKRLRQHVSPKCCHQPTKTARFQISEQDNLNNLRLESMKTLLLTTNCFTHSCVETEKNDIKYRIALLPASSCRLYTPSTSG